MLKDYLSQIIQNIFRNSLMSLIHLLVIIIDYIKKMI